MRINHKTAIVGALVAAAFSTAALADAPRYNFGDLSYSSISDPSGSGLSSDHAFGLDGSYAFTDRVIGIASYAHESADFNFFGSGGSVSSNLYSVGAGYRVPLTDSVDLVPNLSFASADTSVSGGGSSSDTGYVAGVMLRAVVAPQWEVDGSVNHSSVGSAATSVGIGALYDITPEWSVGFAYQNTSTSGDSFNSWTLAARYYFK